MKILVVDDDTKVREMLYEMIPSLGYECRMAANGDEALAILKNDYFPIVISDIRMPGMDGIALLKKIKENCSDSDVISITGCSKDYTFTDVIKAGASDFILKPFSKDELEAKIRRIIRERELKADVIASRNELMAIFNGIRDGMYTVDQDFKILSANKAFAESVGLPIEDIMGKLCYELVSKQDVPCEGDGHSCPAKRSFARGLPAVNVHRRFEKNGREIYLEITAMPLIAGDGKVSQAILLSREITSKYLAEKRLKEAERKYRALVEMAKEGIISTNKEGIINLFNQKAGEIFGYSLEEVIGEHIFLLLPEKCCAVVKAEYEKILTLEKTKSDGTAIEVKGLRKDGSKIPLEISLSTLINEQGELTITLFVKGDIT